MRFYSPINYTSGYLQGATLQTIKLMIMRKWMFAPNVKAIFSIFLVFASGALCSALITQIAGLSGKILWSDMIYKESFYFILALMTISIIYNIFAAKEEKKYKENRNQELIDQFIKGKGIDVLAQKITNAIKEGDTKILSNLAEVTKNDKSDGNENSNG